MSCGVCLALAVVTDTSVVKVDGALEVQWRLPPELSVSGERVKVEVNVTGEWVEVDSDTHIMSLSAAESFTLHLRVSVCGVGCVWV